MKADTKKGGKAALFVVFVICAALTFFGDWILSETLNLPQFWAGVILFFAAIYVRFFIIHEGPKAQTSNAEKKDVTPALVTAKDHPAREPGTHIRSSDEDHIVLATPWAKDDASADSEYGRYALIALIVVTIGVYLAASAFLPAHLAALSLADWSFSQILTGGTGRYALLAMMVISAILIYCRYQYRSVKRIPIALKLATLFCTAVASAALAMVNFSTLTLEPQRLGLSMIIVIGFLVITMLFLPEGPIKKRQSRTDAYRA